MLRHPRRFVACLVMLIASCGRSTPPPAPVTYGTPGYGGYGYGEPVGQFKDDAQSNAQLDPESLALDFVDSTGKPVNINDYRGSKNVVLIFTRGYPGFVCPNCSTLTSRLIANHDEFTKRDAEVLVVYPGDKAHLDDFVKASKPAQSADKPVPFAILLDEGFQAVDKLKIRADLAKPSTFILDKEGQVRFAYVGASSADRPSIKAMLDQLDAIQGTGKTL
jgi:peroxiredoxin